MLGGFDFSKIDLNGMLGDIASKAEAMKSEYESKIFTAKSGGGMVEVKINGKGEVIDLNLDESLMDDKESLQILLISAFNEASKQVEEEKRKQAMGMLGGFNPFDKK